MSEITEFKVGAAIIHHPEYYVMHRRTEGRDNGEIGQLGLYGGQPKEEDGDMVDTAVREIKEESGVSLPRNIFSRPEQNNTIFVLSERGGENILTEVEIFIANIPSDISHKEFEYGEPMTFKQLRRAKALGELTTVAVDALTKFIGV